jgi:hypothetical protein
MEFCYCKKTLGHVFLDIPFDISDILENSNSKTKVDKTIVFEEGKYYEFYFEGRLGSKDTVWVIYDKNGDVYHQGLRFQYDRLNDRKILHLFHAFFDHVDRKYKLNNLNNLIKNA